MAVAHCVVNYQKRNASSLESDYFVSWSKVKSITFVEFVILGNRPYSTYSVIPKLDCE